MPINFWNDDGNEKYRNAYLDVYTNVLTHGDYTEIIERGDYLWLARRCSKTRGVRIDKAGIYRQVAALEEFTDSV